MTAVTTAANDGDNDGTGTCPCLTDDPGTGICRAWQGLPNMSFCCSRVRGHEGSHIACAVDEHGLATWSDDDGSEEDGQ